MTQGGGARSSPEDGSTAPPHPSERPVPVKEPEELEESRESEESGVAEGAGPAAASGAAAASGPRTIRMRISEGDPWSVMVTSFLLLAGVGILAFATTVVLWILMEAMAPDVLPDLGTVVAIAIGVVTVEVVLGTGLATLGTFLYNLSSLYSGGVEVSVTDDLDLPPAAAQVLPAMARARARVRRSLRGRTPWPRSWSR
ncbi:integral membrane protein [Streptomyces hygroscopicus subsp. jinggangensis 5008]|nr:integral membrane protein [Streptomyces hygroscopicus subsp. jinggangensis 5008]AGF60241.1 integral membrane protein [Streptomyces hygroscopicus subsp. jinggangensis TL01]